MASGARDGELNADVRGTEVSLAGARDVCAHVCSRALNKSFFGQFHQFQITGCRTFPSPKVPVSSCSLVPLPLNAHGSVQSRFAVLQPRDATEGESAFQKGGSIQGTLHATGPEKCGDSF